MQSKMAWSCQILNDSHLPPSVVGISVRGKQRRSYTVNSDLSMPMEEKCKTLIEIRIKSFFDVVVIVYLTVMTLLTTKL